MSANADSDTMSSEGLEEAIQFAKKYLEDMLSFFGLNTEVHASAEDDVIQLGVPSTHLNGFLIGSGGETMRALQFITGSALKSNQSAFNRVNVDIADYKRQRADRLGKKAEAWINEVKESKKPKELEPMNAADRRIVHKLAGEAGLASESTGEGRDRRVVLKPAEG